jgi:hypothetical protein
MGVTWFVEYRNGLITGEPTGAEMERIEWGRVVRVILASAEGAASLPLEPIPARLTWALRRREFKHKGRVFEAMMLLVVPCDVEINDDSVLHAIFWTQDGRLHTCNHLWCGEVAAYAARRLRAEETTLVPSCYA